MTHKHHDAHDAAMHTLRKLRTKGYEAFFAGGCVRDRLLNLIPKDFDIATNARPEQVTEIFPRARCVGAIFGVVLIHQYDHDIEVATFRADGDYVDGRHPDHVTFGTAEQDAQRRDFTINGLFFDPIEQRVIDYVGGQADLKAGIVRTIGSPTLRLEEDHLRMLRAVRFAARLSFTIHTDTMTAIQQHAPKLCRISPERIWMELSAILSAPTRSAGWQLLIETGLRPHLCATWPVDENQDRLTLKRLAALPQAPIDSVLGLSACTPPDPKAVCQTLRMSNRQTGSVVWLLAELPRVFRQELLELADLKQLMGRAEWSDLLLLLEADLNAKSENMEVLRSLLRRADEISPESVAPPPLLTGNDLLDMGIDSGPKLGRIIDAVYRAQLNEEIATRDEAFALVHRVLCN